MPNTSEAKISPVTNLIDLMRRRFALCVLGILCLIGVTACTQGNVDSSVIVYVTATPIKGPGPITTLGNVFTATLTPSRPTPLPIHPTANLPPNTMRYMVEQGDTPVMLAAAFGISVNALSQVNSGLDSSTTLTAGQVLTVPALPATANTTPSFKILPDSELVNSPAARGFDVESYVNSQPGFIRVYSETVQGRLLNSGQIIDFLATANSINPRILLALIEYRGNWITQPVPSSDQMDYPLGYVNPDFKGLFKQLSWAASTLNQGYYGWKYRGMTLMRFPDGTRLAFAPSLNAGTVAVQYLFSRTANRVNWLPQVQSSGAYATYRGLFGDPFRYAIDPVLPGNLTAPTLQLPFPAGQTWYFTGGPHGGWDAPSGWAAIDFAPPSPPDSVLTTQGQCYVSDFFAASMSAGVVVRSGDGLVEVSLDPKGDPRVGWTLIYLHIADKDRIAAGVSVQPGKPLGHPSCQGFDLAANATHLHIARLYNGEWVPIDCWGCASNVSVPPFVIGGWRTTGLPAQIYQGTLERSDQPVVHADQGRTVTDNQISW